MNRYFMNKLSSTQRSFLRSQTHHLEPVILIGKNGLREGTFHAIQACLEARKLIMIKFLDFKDGKQEISDKIATETLSLIVEIIGHTLILFKQNTYTKKQKY